MVVRNDAYDFIIHTLRLLCCFTLLIEYASLSLAVIVVVFSNGSC